MSVAAACFARAHIHSMIGTLVPIVIPVSTAVVLSGCNCPVTKDFSARIAKDTFYYGISNLFFHFVEAFMATNSAYKEVEPTINFAVVAGGAAIPPALMGLMLYYSMSGLPAGNDVSERSWKHYAASWTAGVAIPSLVQKYLMGSCS